MDKNEARAFGIPTGTHRVLYGQGAASTEDKIDASVTTSRALLEVMAVQRTDVADLKASVNKLDTAMFVEVIPPLHRMSREVALSYRSRAVIQSTAIASLVASAVTATIFGIIYLVFIRG